MKKLLVLVSLSVFLLGCEGEKYAFMQGERVRIKGTTVEGRIYYSCMESSYCEVSYSHGKLLAPTSVLEKIEEGAPIAP